MDVDKKQRWVRSVCSCTSLYVFGKIAFLAVCMIEEKQQADHPGPGVLQKQAYSWAAENIILLNTDVCTLPGYFAQEGGVVWEFISEVWQRHSVADRLQLLHSAFVFELLICWITGHIGVNGLLPGSDRPRELIGVDFIRLRLDQTVYSQFLILFHAHGHKLRVYWNEHHSQHSIYK